MSTPISSFEAFPNDIVTRVIKVRLKYMHKEFLKNILNMSQYDCYICYYSITVRGMGCGTGRGMGPEYDRSHVFDIRPKPKLLF